MRRFNIILITLVSAILLTCSLALAKNKFKNEDTAKNRQDNTFGTDQSEETSTTTFDNNDQGETTIKTKRRPKEEEVDWYDKVIITVDPITQWPRKDTPSTKTGGSPTPPTK